jgi:hypothetical protein
MDDLAVDSVNAHFLIRYCLGAEHDILTLIQAKHILQDLVVVVSLVRTLAESFGSASDLYRKLKRKGKEIREGSDDEDRHRKPLRKRRDSDSDSNSSSFRKRLRRRSKSRKREKDYSDSEEESIYSSGAVLKREYDRGYDRLGERFAIGDCTCSLLRNDLDFEAETNWIRSVGAESPPSADNQPAANDHSNLPKLRT